MYYIGIRIDGVSSAVIAVIIVVILALVMVIVFIVIIILLVLKVQKNRRYINSAIAQKNYYFM